MPLYEYKCKSCGDVFEVMQKFSEAPLTSHEGCGGAVERLLSAPALQFKGTGWYITDYARGNGNSKEKTTNTDSKSDSKSDSKTNEGVSKSETPSTPAVSTGTK
ncbi:MAG: zinc ribbon domain-containing protein [Bryobacteraceae bacterium]|nr:zinc ribbon domain-containing protein [Bryobacterales bacterium]NUN02524.1 zinc ribbon domain-containing protein [Bryobacteraceae bacterium]